MPENYRSQILKAKDCFESVLKLLAFPGQQEHNFRHVIEQL